ncbi:MAG: hypothetical protein KF721_05935 [Ignavibacteriaceae bacterium]|nr:hypothetical protein [Ignavibacteriaceae bacterium]
MNTRKNLVSILFSLLFIYGCSDTRTLQTLYLGNAEVYSPITPPPIHIGEKENVGDIIISPSLSMNQKDKVTFRTSNAFKGSLIISDSSIVSVNDKNFEWNFPRYQIGVDVDAMLSRNIAFFVGGTYSKYKQINSLGWNVGFGLFSQKSEIHSRLDVGLLFQTYFYDAETIVHTREVNSRGSTVREYDLYFKDRGGKTNYSFFTSFTLHSSGKDDLFNYGLTFSYFTHELLSYEPGRTTYESAVFVIDFQNMDNKTDLRPEVTPGFILLAPILSFKIAENARMHLILNAMKEIRMEQTFSHWLMLPKIQFDISF